MAEHCFAHATAGASIARLVTVSPERLHRTRALSAAADLRTAGGARAALARLRAQALVLTVLCLIEGVGAVVWLADGWLEPLFEERLFCVWGGTLGVLSAALGMYGAARRSRSSLLIFFINQLWVRALGEPCALSLAPCAVAARQATRVAQRALTSRVPPAALRRVSRSPRRACSPSCARRGKRASIARTCPLACRPSKLELDCAEVGGRVGRRLASGVARLLSMWAAAFVAYRLSEIMQEKDVSSEDARLVALILRVKSELQESATEFEEFICKRLDDVEHAMPARGGAHQVVYR